MTTLEQIIEWWKVDTVIDNTDLGNESIKIPKLHAKYYEQYCKEKLILTKSEHEYYTLAKIKNDYYRGRMSREELAQYGWEQFQLRVVKEDLEFYIKADPDLQAALMKLSLQQEKVSFLKEIVNSLHGRGFQISSAISFIKWTNGG